MIRMRPFHKMSYSELQSEYLQELVVARAVAFYEREWFLWHFKAVF